MGVFPVAGMGFQKKIKIKIKSNQIKSNEIKYFKNEIFKNKIFVVKNDLMWNYCLAFPMNARTLCIKCFLCVNRVLGLCLRLIDTALEFNLPFDICRRLVESEDVEIVHEVLAKHHQCLTSRHLLRL